MTTLAASGAVDGAEQSDLIGLAALMRTAYAGEPLQPTWDALSTRTDANPSDAAAYLDMSTVLRLSGRPEQAQALQAHALTLGRVFRRPHGRADRLRVLAFVIAGDLMANTPLDFLLEGSDFELWLAYLDEGGRPPTQLPEHDVAVFAVGESPTSGPVLAGAAAWPADWPRPVFNGAPKRIAELTRDGVASAFAGDAQVVAPPVLRLARDRLTIEAVGLSFPLIVRPVGSHAGQGLAKIDDPDALTAYRDERAEAEFYVSPFVDYAGPDGLYRKQRIVFVEGRPFIAHMAVSEHWMVHYLSAGMAENAARRDEEAAFMRDFDAGFARRHAAAFARLHDRIGLDYFGVDCAELPDGRLLLFEADVAMIVHALDPDPPFGYKREPMAHLFEAFQSALVRRARLP